MTDEEFAKSMGATPMSDEDFAKHMGATPVEETAAEKLKRWALIAGHNLTPAGVEENAKGIATAAGDMALGIPKFGGQILGTVGGMAEQAGNKLINGKPAQHSIKDLWDESGKFMDDKIPSLGQKYGTSDNGAYQGMMTPFRVLGELSQEAGQKVKDVTGSSDAQGLTEMGANVLIPGLIHKAGSKLGSRETPKAPNATIDALDAAQAAHEGVKTVNPETHDDVWPGQGLAPDGLPLYVEGNLWRQLATQQELPFTSNEEAIAAAQNARGNQHDLFNDNQGAPPVPYDPTGRLPTDHQNELPLENSTEQIAQRDQEAHGQFGLFGDPQNTVSGDPMRSIPEITPQVALRRALDAEDAANSAKDAKEHAEKTAEASFWRDRAMQMIREERAKQAAAEADRGRQPIAVNQDGTAAPQPVMDALHDSTKDISYENVPPDGTIPRDAPNAGLQVPRNADPRWVPDENGIPVRQGLPMDTPDTSLPAQVQGILNQDTGARNDLGNAIQEANGPKTGPDEHWGSTPLDRNPVNNLTLGLKNRPIRNSTNSKFGGGQRGAIDLEAGREFLRRVDTAVHWMGKQVVSATAMPIRMLVRATPEDYLKKYASHNPEVSQHITTPKPGSDFVAKAQTQTIKERGFWPSFQSGLGFAAQKTGSALLDGAGQWLRWAHDKGEQHIIHNVKPLEKRIAALSSKEIQTLHQVVMKQMMEQKNYHPDVISAVLGPKMAKLHDELRAQFDKAYDMDSAARKFNGEEPVSKHIAYAASQRYGDISIPIVAKDGTYLHYFRETNILGAKKALSWAKEKYGEKNLDMNQTSIMHQRDINAGNIPRDILGGYQEFLRFLGPDHDASTLISDAIDKWNSMKGETYKGQYARHMDKHFIRGFEGDKPYKTAHQNAADFLNAQMNYLKGTAQWSFMQEALKNVNDIIKDPTLAQKQPKLVKFAQDVTSRQLGVNLAVTKGLEDAVTRALGGSRGLGYGVIRSLKGMMYLKTLSFNMGYAIATPLQMLFAMDKHIILSDRGYKHNAFTTFADSLQDTMAAYAKLAASDALGAHIKMEKHMELSPIGKDALTYLHDIGRLSYNFSDGSHNIGGLKTWGATKDTAGRTISVPEQLGAIPTYLSFVHHLMQSGMDKELAFKRASDWTDTALTGQTKLTRPLWVDKAGMGGDLSNAFTAWMVNEANQIGLLLDHTRKTKNPTAITVHISALLAAAGILGTPALNIYDGAANLFKDMVANAFPEHYPTVQKAGAILSPRLAVLQHTNELASEGPLSVATGTSVGSRFGIDFVNAEHPFQNLTAMPQWLWQAGKDAGQIVQHPLTGNSYVQGFHNSIAPSMVRGLMEEHMDAFKAPAGSEPGKAAFKRASNIAGEGHSQVAIKRDAHDESVKQWGLTSLKEQKTRDIQFAKDEEAKRVESAMKHLVSRMADAVLDKDTETATKEAQAMMQLIPDSKNLQLAMDRAFQNTLDPQERDKLRAARGDMAAIMKQTDWQRRGNR